MKQPIIFLMAAILWMSVGCSKKEDNPGGGGGNNATDTTTTTTTSTTTTTLADGGRQDHNIQEFWATGGTATLNVVDYPTLEKYTGRPMGSTYDIQLNVSLTNAGTSSGSTIYGGNIKIGYHEKDGNGNVTFSYGTLTSGTQASDNIYNKWLSASTFHGFFQDSWGALILVVDAADDANNLSGKVYFRNFNLDICNTQPPYYCAQQSPKACWFISLGPYDCRDFLVDNKVVTSSRLYPSSYTLLGTFTGLAGPKAFAN